MSELVDDIRANLAGVRNRIVAAGGAPEAVTLVAVTKGFGPEVVQAAMAAGCTELGESYQQELTDKVEALEGEVDPTWHFIGRLQRNKVKKLVAIVSLWHSIDRVELATEVAKWSPGARVLVQLAADGDDRGGCPLSDADQLVDQLRSLDLDLCGVMAVGLLGDDAATSRLFERATAFADRQALPIRSLGMTADLELAISAGSNLLRVGTALFGPRAARGGVEH